MRTGVPWSLQFKDRPSPFKLHQCPYFLAQHVFLKNVCYKLESQTGFPKPFLAMGLCGIGPAENGHESFRFTVHLRPVNFQTKRHVWAIPNAGVELLRLSGSTFLSHFDRVSAYGQMPLAEGSSRECQYFHPPSGVFSPTRVLHRAIKPVSFFQSTMENSFREVDVLVWLDYIMPFESDAAKLLSCHVRVFPCAARAG